MEEVSIVVTQPNTTHQCAEISIRDDNLLEGDETFSVTVSSQNDNAVILKSSSVVITILDDDGNNCRYC